MLHHFLGNARQLGDAIRDVAFGIDQGFPGFNDFFPIVNYDTDLGDLVPAGPAAGGFHINDGVAFHGRQLEVDGR